WRLNAEIEKLVLLKMDFSGEKKKEGGGEIRDYTKMMAESREQALDRMVEEAEKMGANAVINVRITTSMIMQSASEIMVYGTAVIVE
ncbi:MAG: YbjQ family protein, partial [Acidobacteria bacterium]|nr:YbjQ family protein [Acidobacteriota bacterium]